MQHWCTEVIQEHSNEWYVFIPLYTWMSHFSLLNNTVSKQCAEYTAVKVFSYFLNFSFLLHIYYT